MTFDDLQEKTIAKLPEGTTHINNFTTGMRVSSGGGFSVTIRAYRFVEGQWERYDTDGDNCYPQWRKDTLITPDKLVNLYD